MLLGFNNFEFFATDGAKINKVHKHNTNRVLQPCVPVEYSLTNEFRRFSSVESPQLISCELRGMGVTVIDVSPLPLSMDFNSICSWWIQRSGGLTSFGGPSLPFVLLEGL
jgi:hypothetical protein